MKTSDLIIVAATAALTALLAGPLLHPGTLEAEEDLALVWGMQPDGPTIVEADGLVLTLERDQESYEAGAQPVLTLVAKNEGKKKRSARTTVRLFRQEQANFASRAMPMPTEAFTKAVDLEVPAGETVRIPVATEIALAAGDTIRLLLQSGETTHPAGMFSVPGEFADAPFAVAPATEVVEEVAQAPANPVAPSAEDAAPAK